jgi:hypothetical protein
MDGKIVVVCNEEQTKDGHGRSVSFAILPSSRTTDIARRTTDSGHEDRGLANALIATWKVRAVHRLRKDRLTD